MSVARSADESLIVVPADHLRATDLGQGFVPSAEPFLTAALGPGLARIMLRSSAETDPRFKQIVGYVILRYADQVFHYRRSGSVGERRLAGLRSLGVGGHLNADDVAGDLDLESIRRAIRRELSEEVTLSEQPRLRFVGVINDDSTEVGKVHLGVVAVAELESPEATLRDPTLLDGQFDPVAHLIEQAEAFENWSRLCFAALLSPRETS